MNSDNLGKVLREIANDRNLSLRDFANIVGVSHVHIRRLMTGTDPCNNKPFNPSIYLLLKIADKLEIPRVDFLQQCGYLDKSEFDTCHISIITETQNK